jgi:hypothetical protein
MTESIPRSFSVDDLIGGVMRLSGSAGGGSGLLHARNDSEAAFQEFLKRIPSATNLAAGGGAGLDAGTLSATAQQLLSAGSGLTVGGDGSGGLTGMPRVPSLDLLRQLVMSGSMAAPPVVVKASPSPTGASGSAQCDPK